MRFSNTAIHRRERRERHEDEEQRAPNVAERHLPEDDRKRDEHERGALIGADAVGEAGGEDDESREYGDDGVQRRHGDGLARQRALLSDVAAEDLHGRDTERKREERLPHGSVNGVAECRHLLGGRAACEQA